MHGENSWLLIRQGTRYALLARDAKSFYFIEIGRYHTRDVEQKLTGSPITRKTLEELGLKFSTLSCANLRAVAIGGVEQGDSMYFYPVNGKRKTVTLGEDVAGEWLDAFFADVERFTPPADPRKRKQDPDYWRKERQNPERKKRLEWAVPLLTALSVLSIVGFLLRRDWVWLLASLSCLAAPVVMDILFPAYFTLRSVNKSQKEGPRYAISLDWPLFLTGTALLLTYRWNYTYEWQLLGAAAVFALAVGAVLVLLVEEFHREKSRAVVPVLCAFAIGIGVVHNVNSVLDPHPPVVTPAQVTELTQNNNYRRGDDYYCTVVLPDGTTRKVEIYEVLYDRLAVGDIVAFSLHSGALGIEYMDIEFLK